MADPRPQPQPPLNNQPAPQPSTSHPPGRPSHPPTPNLSLTPKDLLRFGRVDSDGTSIGHILSIDNQITLPEQMWNFLHNMTAVDFNLTVDELTRIWQTLIYFRAQQVDEAFNSRRRDHRIVIDPNFMVPAPLADLLDSLGVFVDPHSGITHYVTPPTHTASAPLDFIELDPAVYARWNWVMVRFKRAFSIVPIPSMKEINERPLMLTVRQELPNNLAMIKTLHQGPTAMDGLVRLMNDEIFADPYDAADCHIRMTHRVHPTTAILEYMESYRLEYVP